MACVCVCILQPVIKIFVSLTIAFLIVVRKDIFNLYTNTDQLVSLQNLNLHLQYWKIKDLSNSKSSNEHKPQSVIDKKKVHV